MINRSFSGHPQASNVTGHVSALSDPCALDALFKHATNDIWMEQTPVTAARSTGLMGTIEYLHDTQSHRADLLRKVLFGVIVMGIVVAGVIGYCLNINMMHITSPLTQGNADNLFNPIQQPKDNDEAYALAGLEGIQAASSGPMDTLGEDADIKSVEMAKTDNDPFEPMFGSDDVVSPTAEEDAPPEIYFSGVIDDPVHQKKVAILKIRNSTASPDGSDAFLTVVKRAKESFTVADKTIVIRSISNNSAQLMVNGEPLTVTLDNFNTSDSSNDPSSAANTNDSTSDSDTRTPASNPSPPSSKSILKLND